MKIDGEGISMKGSAMNSEGHQLRIPWAPGRPSLYAFLKEREADLEAGGSCDLPCHEVADALRLPFSEMVSREDLFFGVVEPAVESPGRCTAQTILDLLRSAVFESDLYSSIALYQLLVVSNEWGLYSVWRVLADSGEPILDHPRTFEYCLWLLQNTPDEWAAKFSLEALNHMKRKPPRDILHVFALTHAFCFQACSAIAEHFEDTEDEFIGIAKAHGGWMCGVALCWINSVVRPENKNWILRKAIYEIPRYDGYIYYVAVHGDLISRLRMPTIDIEELVDLAKFLNWLSDASEGGTLNINDYEDGPSACFLLLEHCERQSLDERLFRQIAWLVRHLEYYGVRTRPAPAPTWSVEVRAQIAATGWQYLRRSDWPGHLMREWTMQFAEPSVELLADGDLTRFTDVVEAATQPEEVKRLIDWAIDFLCLESDDPALSMRRVHLEGEEMDGPMRGGFTNLTEDAKLRSVYGQIVFQVLQKLTEAPGVGWKIIKAGLESAILLHRSEAAKALSAWPPEQLSLEILAAVRAAREECDDGDALAAMDKILSCSGSLPKQVIQ